MTAVNFGKIKIRDAFRAGWYARRESDDLPANELAKYEEYDWREFSVNFITEAGIIAADADDDA